MNLSFRYRSAPRISFGHARPGIHSGTEDADYKDNNGEKIPHTSLIGHCVKARIKRALKRLNYKSNDLA